MNIEEIQERAQKTFGLLKDFEYIDITMLDEGGAIIELDEAEVHLNSAGEIEKTTLSL